MSAIIPDQHPSGGTPLGAAAELSARHTAAAAVLGDFRAAEAAFNRGAAQPAYAAWALRLSQHLGYVLSALEHQAAEDGPGSGEGAAVHGLSCGCPECDNDEDEPYCAACGADVGIFIGHGDGDAWLHYTGQGTAADPVELYDAGHEPDVAWRPAGAR